MGANVLMNCGEANILEPTGLFRPSMTASFTRPTAAERICGNADSDVRSRRIWKWIGGGATVRRRASKRKVMNRIEGSGWMLARDGRTSARGARTSRGRSVV